MFSTRTRAPGSHTVASDVPSDHGSAHEGTGLVHEEAGVPDHVDTRTWLQERIDGKLALGVGLAWFVLTQIAFALEPVSREPVPAIGVALEIGMYSLLFTMIAGLALKRRWGLVASLGGALLATAAAIACPISGHHPFGAWWYGQMVCVFALVGVSVFALRREPS